MLKKGITIGRIDAETNGKVILPREPERVRSIKMIEEGNPNVPVFRGYRNVKPTKDKIPNYEEIEATKIEQFKKIPLLSNEEYQLFLSKKYENWYYEFISYAFECLSFNINTKHMNIWCIECDNEKIKEEDIKNVILLLNVYLNYYNDKNTNNCNIHYHYDELEHQTYDNVCYFKENKQYFRFNRVMFLNINPYKEHYTMAFSDSKYLDKGQVVTFDMLQDYALEKLVKVEDEIKRTRIIH